MSIIFDIETRPLPVEFLATICPPFDPDQAVPHPGEFDPASVKTGNLKDAAKISEKVEDARRKHEDLLRTISQRREIAKEQHFADFVAKAALSATTGRVLCIGYYGVDSRKFAISDATAAANEADVIEKFWQKFSQFEATQGSNPRSLIGVNIEQFDLPFLIRRSWILGVDVPETVVASDRFFSSVFIDLSKKWRLGNSFGSVGSSFDELAKAFGTQGKPSGVDGSMFFDLWENDRDAAIEYLRSDVAQPAVWAQRMGVV